MKGWGRELEENHQKGVIDTPNKISPTDLEDGEKRSQKVENPKKKHRNGENEVLMIYSGKKWSKIWGESGREKKTPRQTYKSLTGCFGRARVAN